jgi:hypothetical protein
MERPFIIPGGRIGLSYVVAAPIIMSVVAMIGSDRYGRIWGPVALAVGPLVYLLLLRDRTASPQLPHRASD